VKRSYHTLENWFWCKVTIRSPEPSRNHQEHLVNRALKWVNSGHPGEITYRLVWVNNADAASNLESTVRTSGRGLLNCKFDSTRLILVELVARENANDTAL
jgi:hypothetical protein